MQMQATSEGWLIVGYQIKDHTMENQKGLTLTQHSEISIQRANQINDVSQHALILGDLKASIKQAIDSPSFNQLKASGANVKETRQILAVLISKYANMLTVGGNLRPEHPMQYAESIIQDNPSMSLDDFNILLANGVKGRYNEPGKLFRFDITIIYEWIAAYQNEFWEVKENLPRQKSALELLPDENIVELQEVIVKAEGVKHILPITEQDIRREGLEKPIKRNYIADREEVVMQKLRKEYSLECRDLYTGALKEGNPSFEEWLKLDQ